MVVPRPHSSGKLKVLKRPQSYLATEKANESTPQASAFIGLACCVDSRHDHDSREKKPTVIKAGPLSPARFGSGLSH